jgi:large subunit ribosomal protein L10
LPTPKKVQAVSELEEALRNCAAALLTDYRGLTVAQISTLRDRLREVDAEYHVVKNTLLKRAASSIGIDLGSVEGPTAVAFAKKDPLAPAKVLVEFMRETRLMAPKGGVVEGRVISPEQFEALSRIPPREVLLSQALAGIQAPLAGLVGTLQGIISNLVYTLQAVVDQKTAAAA